MEPTPREIVEYVDANGANPFRKWISRLRDGKGRGVIRNRINRMAIGNFGDCEPVGYGIHELKIDFGPGYRVYFGEDGAKVVLLIGGDKDSQPADIAKAKKYWDDYNA
jgi:putative addiction module killer protein